MNRFTLLVAALISTTSATFAQNADFDVFGVRIGDTPPTVKNSLENKGFSEYQVRRGPNFAEQVAKANPFEAKGAIKEVIFARNDDRVSVSYVPFPDGEKVFRLTYHPAMSSDDCPAFENSAQVKYGVGIKHGGSWIDRPLVKKGAASLPSEETVSIVLKCGAGSRFLDMSQLGALSIQKRLIDEADGKFKPDF